MAMLRNGFTPIPINGKDAFLAGWQRLSVNEIVIAGWGENHNTGMRTAYAPVFDSDILDGEAAELVENIIIREFSGRGVLICRRGMPPKFAFVFQTPEPFKKIQRKFRAPDGTIHKIEILGDGQQLAVAGIHPMTHQAFTWKHGSASPISRIPICRSSMLI
jgi:hypothetical protein